MNYDDRPWLRHYEERLSPEISVPDITSVDLMEASFADFADRPAFHFLGVSKTFAEVDAYSLRFANFLAEIGCGPGDAVGISLPNIPQYMIAHAGALRAGCAATGVSFLLSAKEVTHQLNDSGARVFVTMDTLFDQRFLKVFSREAEETLYEHPAVEYCAYVGLQNPERPDSHRVKAVIQLASEYKGKDEEQLETEIVAFCRENMAPYKVPKIVQFVDAIPLTSVGKVDKKALR